MRWQALGSALLAIALVATVAPGCLDDNGDEETYWDWQLGLSLDEFNSNGQRPVTLNNLSFKVTFGPLSYPNWLLRESHSFQKGNDSYFALRIEASYDDPGTGPEDFPIQGTSSTATAALEFIGGRMKVTVDGASDTYTVSNKIDLLPHDMEKTVTLTGTYGELDLYFHMLEPK